MLLRQSFNFYITDGDIYSINITIYFYIKENIILDIKNNFN